MSRTKYEEVPVKQTPDGIDVALPLVTANELGFMRLSRGPIEFGQGKTRVTLHIDENRERPEARK
jgi:hypothetical protein